MNTTTMINNPTTYIYGDTEVKLTGRIAERKIKATSKRTTDRTDTIYEITPNNNENGSWKRWVCLLDLFEVQPHEDT